MSNELGLIDEAAFKISLPFVLHDLKKMKKNFFMPHKAFTMFLDHFATEDFKQHYSKTFDNGGRSRFGTYNRDDKDALLKERLKFLTELKKYVTDLAIWDEEAGEIISWVDKSLSATSRVMEAKRGFR